MFVNQRQDGSWIQYRIWSCEGEVAVYSAKRWDCKRREGLVESSVLPAKSEDLKVLWRSGGIH